MSCLLIGVCLLLAIPSSGCAVSGHPGFDFGQPLSLLSTRLVPACLYYVMVSCLALIVRSPTCYTRLLAYTDTSY